MALWLLSAQGNSIKQSWHQVSMASLQKRLVTCTCDFFFLVCTCTLFLLISTVCLNLYCYISVSHALSVSPHEFSFLHLLILMALTQCLRECFFMLRQACVCVRVFSPMRVEPSLSLLRRDTCRLLTLICTNLFELSCCTKLP